MSIQRQYRACGICKKEFFSVEEYDNHPCRQGKGKEPCYGTMTEQNETLRKMLSIGGASALNNSPYIAQAVKESIKDNKNTVSKNDDIDLGMTDASIDRRLVASQELTNLKHVLKEAGIECATMTASEAKQAYAKLQTKKNSVVDNQTTSTRKSKVGEGEHNA